MAQLFIVGLGLDPHDLGERAKAAIAQSQEVLLETYTSTIPYTQAELEAIMATSITPLTRAMVEQEDVVFEKAKRGSVALLVFGDALAATTHTELVVRSRAEGIETRIIPAASIISAIGQAGLEIYRYATTASLVYPRKGWLPERAKRIIDANRSSGAHTLVLLDIVTGSDELSLLERDHEAFGSLDTSVIEHETTSLAGEPQLLMSPNEAIALLEYQGAIRGDETIIICSRLGTSSSAITASSAGSLKHGSFGLGPHAIVVPGELHFLEKEALEGHRQGKGY